jgi:DNA invertase Pin-like site-specific DNA recombinase
MMRASTHLRVGALARVSTERQEARGESLAVQERQIREAVEKIGGLLISQHFYIGQEHGTEGFDRERFTRLLNDVLARRVDTVMFADASRFNRKPMDNEQFIEACVHVGCRFFILEREYDLHNPLDRYFLTAQSALNRLVVEENLRKSRTSRIARARRGFPTSGGAANIPFGRRVVIEDGVAKWSICEEERVQLLAWRDALLSGESFEKIGKRANIAANTIRRRLLSAGNIWLQRFKYRNEWVEVCTEIPQILTVHEIAEVRACAQGNKLIRRRRFDYPLSRLIRCGTCGCLLSGAGTESPYGVEARYYRHRGGKRMPGCIKAVPGRMIETAIIGHIAEVLRDEKQIAAAVARAAKVSRGDEGRESLRRDVDKAVNQKKSVVRKITALVRELSKAGKRTADEIRRQLGALEEQAGALEAQLEFMQGELRTLELNVNVAERVKQTLFALTGRNGNAPLMWKPKDQELLVRSFVGAVNRNDHEAGVWVNKSCDGHFTYCLRGRIVLLDGVTWNAPSDLIEMSLKHRVVGGPDPSALGRLAHAAYDANMVQRAYFRARSSNARCTSTPPR